MKIVLRSKPMAPTEAMKAAVDAGLNKIRTSVPLTRAEVYMTTENCDHVTLIRLHGKHLDLVAKAHAGNMYQALRSAIDKIKAQIQKVKA